MNAIAVKIPSWRPASINMLMASHWTKAGRMKRLDADLLALYFLPHPKATGRRRLSVTIGNKQRGHQLDADNALKSLLDGLKRCGAIIDDSAEFLAAGAAPGENLDFFRAARRSGGGLGRQ